mmetsp:Transcript_23637/g.48925  ORF Transcript_23637/g.48925 Transcript_23637/m.48925 type:complete len:88 (+) Transcript_23637:71-334(+)
MHMLLPCWIDIGGAHWYRQCSDDLPRVIIRLEITTEKCRGDEYNSGWMDLICSLPDSFADIERCADSIMGNGFAGRVFRGENGSSCT